MGDMKILVPEDIGAKIRFGTLTMKDIMIFVLFLVGFIAIATVIPNIIVQLILIVLGFVFGLIFAFRKVDNLDMTQYFALKLTRRKVMPTLGVSVLKLYGDETLYNGLDYFRIIEVRNGISIDYMSDEAKLKVLTIYEQLLNACDFPLQIIVKTRKIKENVFDRLINEDSELARGYKNLIHQFTRDLHLQFFYVVVPVRYWELQGSSTEAARLRKANELLDVRVSVILDYMNALQLPAYVLKGKVQIYEVVKKGLR